MPLSLDYTWQGGALMCRYFLNEDQQHPKFCRWGTGALWRAGKVRKPTQNGDWLELGFLNTTGRTFTHMN